MEAVERGGEVSNEGERHGHPRNPGDQNRQSSEYKGVWNLINLCNTQELSSLPISWPDHHVQEELRADQGHP